MIIVANIIMAGKNIDSRWFHYQKHWKMEAKQTNKISSISKISTWCYHKSPSWLVKGCLQDTSLQNAILHHGMNDLKRKSTSEQIANNIISVAISVKSDENCVFVQGIATKTDKLNYKVPKWVKSYSVYVQQLINLLLTIQTFTQIY